MAVTSRNTFSLHSIGTSNKCNHFSVMVLWLATPTHRFKCAGLVVRCAVGLALASTHASRHNIRDAIFIFTCDVDGFLPVFQPTMTTAFDTVDSENDEKYSSEQRSPHLEDKKDEICFSFHFISFHFIPIHSIPFHFISFHLHWVIFPLSFAITIKKYKLCYN